MSDSSSFYTLHNKSPSSKSILISFAIQCECGGLISQKFHISIPKPGLHTAHEHASITSNTAKGQNNEWVGIHSYLDRKDMQIMPCQCFFSTDNSDVHCEVDGLIGPLGNYLGISASAAVESIHLKSITQSASYLYTTRHWEFSFLNFWTIQFYFLISSPAFLSQISASELLGSPPTAIPSTPPNNRTNSLINSPNLNYSLTATLCVWSTDVDPYIASKTNLNPPPAFLCCVCDSQ